MHVVYFLLLIVLFPALAVAQIDLGADATLPEGLPGWVYVTVPLAISSLARLASVVFKSNNVVMKILDFVAMAWYRARVDPEKQK